MDVSTHVCIACTGVVNWSGLNHTGVVNWSGHGKLLQRKWWGILGVGLQRGVAHILRHEMGADLLRTQLEPATLLAELA